MCTYTHPALHHTRTHTHTDSCSYKLEKGALKVSEVFQLLDSVKSEIGILDWGIKMTTLEDGGWSCTHTHTHMRAHTHTHTHTVFLNIVKNTVDDRVPQAGLHMPKWLPCQHCVHRGNSSSE